MFILITPVIIVRRNNYILAHIIFHQILASAISSCQLTLPSSSVAASHTSFLSASCPHINEFVVLLITEMAHLISRFTDSYEWLPSIKIISGMKGNKTLLKLE